MLTEENIKVLYDTFDPTGRGYITIDDFRRTNPEYQESKDAKIRRKNLKERTYSENLKLMSQVSSGTK